MIYRFIYGENIPSWFHKESLTVVKDYFHLEDPYKDPIFAHWSKERIQIWQNSKT